MDCKLREQIVKEKIREMRSPVILMNETDFENFKKKLESEIDNYEIGIPPMFENIPIKTSPIAKEGEIVVCDYEALPVNIKLLLIEHPEVYSFINDISKGIDMSTAIKSNFNISDLQPDENDPDLRAIWEEGKRIRKAQLASADCKYAPISKTKNNKR